MKKIAIAFAASMLGQVCATAEPMPSLGMTRPELWRAAKAALPGLEVPLLSCGKPLVLMHCKEQVSDRLEVGVTETMISTDGAEEFIYGAPGLVYSAGASYRYPHEPAEFVYFIGYCAAFLAATGRVSSAVEGIDLFTQQFEKAVAAVDDGFGMSIDGEEPLVFLVEVMPDYNLVCRVSAQ